MRPRPTPSFRRPAHAPARLALVALVAAAAACGRDAAPPARDEALDRDLTLAASGGARPTLPDSFALGDTATVRLPAALPPAPAPAPAPARPSPPRVAAAPTRRPVERAPAPAAVPAAAPVALAESAAAAPAPAPGPAPSLARGTTLAGATGTRICSTTNRPGDRLVATLAEGVEGENGLRFPAGTGVVLEVARVGEDGKVELLARGVSIDGAFHPIVADVAVGEAALERRTVAGTADSKGKAVKGAIAGAILGQILGRDAKGTIIGAAGGAAAGAAMGQLSKRQEVCLPAGAPVRIDLAETFTLR